MSNTKLTKIKEVKINPKVRDILLLLGGGALLGAFIVFPGLPLAFQSYLKPKYRRKNKYHKYTKAWEKYDQRILKKQIKRLKKQKIVALVEEEGIPVVKLTQKGKLRLLRYNLEEMSLKKKNWDGKWRMIIYDIPKSKKASSEAFRYMLNKIECLKLQRSVYLTPYPCEDEIEYLRQIFNIGDHVILITVSGIENEEVCRHHFKI